MSLAKINSLLEALSTNPFYQRKLGGLTSVSSLEEFTAKVPFTTKAELAADQKLHPPYGSNLTFPLESYHRFHQTSGTSGQPMIWLDDKAGWEWLCGNWAWVWEKAGVTPGQAAFFPFSFGPFLGFWAGFESAAGLGIRAIPAGGLSSENRLRMMERLRPEILCCTPTYGLRLAEVAKDARSLGVEKIIVAGEPGGSLPEVRNRLSKAWDAEVVDHHGMTEIGPVSVGDIADPGRLLVRHEAYFCEVINQDDQGIGELVLTTLGRHGSPILRYRTGDLVQPDEDFALKGGIIGRVDDMVVVRGVNLYPGAVEEVVRSVEGILEYEVQIEEANSMAEVRVRAEGTGARELEGRLREVFSLRIPVEEVPEGTLERFEMKSKRWKRVN
ncbi:phenylacetate--CoA ligase family protein [Akkermansiaceae bacterium]|nr:phenylacetate--CoA ligase family protein [Akkermansiaceae bacterium]MDA7907638.1 phenylacetate--CoA ligase family protein [Akkermansiaceae bacterium]MDB4393391.1 phenylacetate--CoA ligase family protein [bacterium]MDB4464667.1 phenylacetate--CoA ligase family protein [Akkermansiaceae bacterium]